MSAEIKLPKLTYSDLLVHLGRTAGAVSRTVWKDGIDVEQPSYAIVALCEAYARAAVEVNRKGREPMTREQIEVAVTDGAKEFWLHNVLWIIAIARKVEAHHGIRPAGGEQS